jgi:hypothetical protein
MSKLVRFQSLAGKRIKVKTLDFDQPARKKNKHAEFAMVELDWIADMAKAAPKFQWAAILVVMRYLAWKAKSQTFAFPNTLLTRSPAACQRRRAPGRTGSSQIHFRT